MKVVSLASLASATAPQPPWMGSPTCIPWQLSVRGLTKKDFHSEHVMRWVHTISLHRTLYKWSWEHSCFPLWSYRSQCLLMAVAPSQTTGYH